MKKFTVCLFVAIMVMAATALVGCEIDLNINIPNISGKIAVDDTGGDSSAKPNDNSFVDIGDEGGQAEGQTDEKEYTEDDFLFTISLEKTTFRVDENPVISLTFSNKSKNMYKMRKPGS